MADPIHHPTDALHDAVDGRLPADARAALEEHLRSCDVCRRELHALQWTKARISDADAGAVPVDLVARLRDALDLEDRVGSPDSAREGRPSTSSRRPLVRWAALAAAFVAVVWLAYRLQTPSMPASAASAFREFRSGSLPLGVRSNDSAVLEGHLRARQVPSRVYDFRMMGYLLEGGGAHSLGRSPSGLSAYHGTDGQPLICIMYLGRTSVLPSPAQRRTIQGVEFIIYRDSDVTVVFWQEGDIVCVLAGDGNPDTIVGLAAAKAVRT